MNTKHKFRSETSSSLKLVAATLEVFDKHGMENAVKEFIKSSVND